MNDDFHDLLAKARAGDASAIDALIRLYEPDVRLIVRSKLPRVLRSQFDSMDFVQAVWASVLVREGPDSAPIRDADQFRGYLAGVARNKVLMEYRRRTRTRKYDISRERPLYVRRGDGDRARDVPAGDPSPSQEFLAAELLGRLEGGDPEVAEIVALRREGLSFEQIAARVGRSDRAIRRLLDGVRGGLEANG